MLRKFSILLAAALLMGAAEPGPEPSSWLQARLDRILTRLGSAPGEVKAMIVDTTDIAWVQPTRSIDFPRALLVMAPSPEAVDAMLAMILSYQEQGLRDREPGEGLSARIRGSSGESGERDDGGARITVGSGQPQDIRNIADQRRARAWQGARWNGLIGNCAAVQVDFLRAAGKEERLVIAGKPFTWPGSNFTRKVIEYLGALAYPGGDRPCRTRDDPDFARIREALAAPADK